MAKQTKQQQIISQLMMEGYTHAHSGSNKYAKLVKADETLWVGKAGAVRCGRTISGSFSITDSFNVKHTSRVAT